VVAIGNSVLVVVCWWDISVDWGRGVGRGWGISRGGGVLGSGEGHSEEGREGDEALEIEGKFSLNLCLLVIQINLITILLLFLCEMYFVVGSD
jgi:hypothetical protein